MIYYSKSGRDESPAGIYQGNVMEPEVIKLLFEEAKHFVTIKNERLLIARRQHVVTLIPQFFIITLGFLLSIFFLTSLGFYSPLLIPLCISLSFLVIATGILLVSKVIVTWQFHLYIITNKKILEASYVPLSDYSINEILLDQVKCTEVDIHTHGVIHELFNIGDIALTFDRPTHHENFTLHRIPDVRETAVFLISELIEKNAVTPQSKKKIQQIWYRERQELGEGGYRYSEDSLPERLRDE